MTNALAGYGDPSYMDGHPSGRRQHNTVHGSAYIFSYSALRKLGCRLQGCRGGTKPERPEEIGEDIFVSDQMRMMGVEPHDTRDACGRERFHAAPPAQMTSWAATDYRYRMSSYNTQDGLGCCSSEPIAYHNFKGMPPDLPSLPEMHDKVNALCKFVPWPAAHIYMHDYQVELQRLSTQSREQHKEIQHLPDSGAFGWLPKSSR